MLRSVVPKLGVCLRDEFVINPRKQDMVPLDEWVLPWRNLLRDSTFSQLIEVNFFPKWLEILYIWLIQPGYKPDEVANWYISCYPLISVFNENIGLSGGKPAFQKPSSI